MGRNFYSLVSTLEAPTRYSHSFPSPLPILLQYHLELKGKKNILKMFHRRGCSLCQQFLVERGQTNQKALGDQRFLGFFCSNLWDLCSKLIRTHDVS